MTEENIKRQRGRIRKRRRHSSDDYLTDEELLADAMKEALEWQERKRNGQIF